LESICSRVKGGRVVFRPDGSPIIDVKSPIKKITRWPRSCKSRSLLRTTVWPRWMSGAVGSSPSLILSGTPVASERASFWIQSLSGISSLQRRSERSRAWRTASVTG
jgi:hypothetical protein